MFINVCLFAHLRERMPGLKIGEAVTLELPDGTTGEQLLQKLRITPEEGKLFLVNGTHREHRELLHDGDVVAIFPPLGGG
jgi:molybdopterin synthase sulfur carrier subunit